MGRFLVAGLPLLAWSLFAGCEATSHSLQVVNGEGSGSYYLTETATIKADEPPFNCEFDRWVGDVETIADVTEPETTMVMPNADVTVSASYKVVACRLDVFHGTGAGDYQPQETVTIRADSPAAGQVFASWTGDVATVADITQPETTIELTRGYSRVEATYVGAPVVVPPDDDDDTPGPPTGYTAIPGDRRDKGGEIMSGFGFDVRALANEDKVDGLGGYYFIGDLVWDLGSDALSITQGASSGTVRFQMKDFKSPRTGLYYMACGYTEVRSSNPLVWKTSGEVARRDTLRFYWLTIDHN